MTETNQFYIKRCLQIAKNGTSLAMPNPSVGAVVVFDGKIIGEGFTSKFGGNHAEVNAIKAVKDIASLKQATLYVTLEPCSHFGKTPPCVNLIIKHQFKKVVIGCLDSNSLVAGKGVAALKNAGIEVVVGVLEKECLQHHQRFLLSQEKKRPYIILKWAETKNGFIAPLHQEKQAPVFISNQYSQQLVHKMRSEVQAILVGTNTVLKDNPRLNVRTWSGNSPIRVVIDRDLKISNEAAVLDGSEPTIILYADSCTKKVPLDSTLNKKYVAIDFTKNLAAAICQALQKNQIQSMIIEGGAQTLQTFIDENLWDEAVVFTGENEFLSGIKAPVFNKTSDQEISIKNDILKKYTND